MQGHLRPKVKIIGQWPQAIGASGGKLGLLICAH
jgi:hypothetical protein